jgi:hypothetical protein
MKYGTMTFGQAEALVNKLGGMDALKKVLSGRASLRLIPNQPWQTVRLGTFENAFALRQALDQSDKLFHDDDDRGNNCSAIRDDIELIKGECKAQLVIVSVGDLGLGSDRTMPAVYAAAKELGLYLCPEETAAQVLLQCDLDLHDIEKNQEGQLHFATDISKGPIPGRRGYRIRVGHTEEKPYLTSFNNGRGYDGRADREKFVFMLDVWYI